jgi:hypothetical protein
MNNEPVAWTGQNTFCKYCHRIPSQCGCTHPAKTLTDDEIKSEAKYFCHSYHTENPERLVLFARAILRKAQEK